MARTIGGMSAVEVSPSSTSGVVPAWRRICPGLAHLAGYERAWWRHDLTAGLVLTALLVPVGMAYAQAAGLPVTHGLYATLAALLAYAVFGPSRVLVQGPDSSLAGMIASTVLPLAVISALPAPELAAALSLLVGGLCLLAARLRLGFVTELLSKPIRYGYLHGIVLTVLVGQLPRLLGVPTSGEGMGASLVDLVARLLQGQGNPVTAAIGVGSLAGLMLMRQVAPRAPGVLAVVVGATVCSALGDWQVSRGVAVVGSLPQGLPGLHWPELPAAVWWALLPAAAAIALVALADTSLLSRTYAERTGQRVKADEELRALGAVNVATGLWQGFPVSASSSRTPVAEAAGARSQLTGVVGAVCIALLLVWAPRLIHDLPLAALSAVVMAACLSLADLPGWWRLYRQRRSEFGVSLVAMGGVVGLGVVRGIFLAVGLALALFVWRAWRPHDAVLGREDGLKGYHDVARHPQARQVPGLVLFRWDAPLFFANAEIFRERVLQVLAEAPEPPRRIVVLAEPITDIDLTAADMLVLLDRHLSAQGVRLCLAELKGPVKDRLRRCGVYEHFGEARLFPTVGQAVSAYLKDTGVPWRDWEDAPVAQEAPWN